MIKKSIFIKNGKYFYQDYTSNFPYHSIYCEVLSLSAERFFENNISNIDIYLDLESNVYNFFKVLRDDDTRLEIIKILNSNCINDLGKIEEHTEKNIIKALKFYLKLLNNLDNINNLDYLKFYCKRDNRYDNNYIDKLPSKYYDEFGEHKKYIIPIVERLREVQYHKFQNKYIENDNIKAFIDLFDDKDTLFSVDLYDTDIELSIYQNIIDFVCNEKNNIKGLIHIPCNEETFNNILLKLNKHEFDNDIINSSIENNKKYKFKIGDRILAFRHKYKKYKNGALVGTIVNLLKSGVRVFTNKGVYIDIPYECSEKLNNKEEQESIESPINWYGGKWYVVKLLIDLIDNLFKNNKVDKYVECFGGAAHLLFKLPFKPKTTVYNDKNPGLYNLFKGLSSKRKEKIIIEKLSLTPYHQEEWENCNDWAEEKDKDETIRKFYTRTMQARSTNGGWSCTRNKKYSRRGISASVSKWLGNIENNIPRAHKKLKDVIIENNDFEKCIKKHDGIRTFFYVDPPYVPETRTLKKGYEYELSIEDHERLVDVLLNVKGKVMLSGYDNEIYRRLEIEGNFKKILIKEVVKSSINVNREERTGKEYVWINYDIDDDVKLVKYLCNDIIIGFSEKNEKLYSAYLTNNENNNLPQSSNHKVTKMFIKQFEIRNSLKLPIDYKEFLLKFNGGVPKKEILLDGTSIICFFGLGENLNNFNLDINIEKYKNKLHSEVIPIASLNKNKLLCINLNEEHKGIYIYDIYTGKTLKIANKFSEFIRNIA